MQPRRISVLAVLLGISLGLFVTFRPLPDKPVPPGTVLGWTPTPSPRPVAQAAVSPTPGPAPLAAASPTPGAAESAQTVATPPPVATTRPAAVLAIEPAEPPAESEDVAGARIQIDQARLMLRDYRSLFGENPVGTNAEIMKALMGGNPRGATLGPPEGASLNEKGELVDRWGTPYFFHQLSKTEMEVISAGPDRKMFTRDDVK